MRIPSFLKLQRMAGRMPYILVFILPLPVDIVLLSLRLCRIARLSLLLLGAPVVNTSPADTAPLGLLGVGAMPLGTSLGLDVLGEVCDGVVWAKAALVLHRAAATRK